MPTTAVFEKLTAAQDRLNDATKNLNDYLASATFPGSGAPSGEFAQLEGTWEQAFRDFKLASMEFSALVQELAGPPAAAIIESWVREQMERTLRHVPAL